MRSVFVYQTCNPECKDKKCEVIHRCGANKDAEKCKPGANSSSSKKEKKCIHPCGVIHGLEECKMRPCGMELKCATKKAKTYDTEDEVFKHWNYDCEAFFFYCPNCSTPFRNKEHNLLLSTSKIYIL